MEKDNNLTFAENLIQIWARKKYAHQHKDGDIYHIEVEGWSEGYCETCRSDEVGIVIYKQPWPGVNKYDGRKRVDRMTYVVFPELLNEMLYALKPLDES